MYTHSLTENSTRSSDPDLFQDNRWRRKFVRTMKDGLIKRDSNCELKQMLDRT